MRAAALTLVRRSKGRPAYIFSIEILSTSTARTVEALHIVISPYITRTAIITIVRILVLPGICMW
jgi:hypothetical protein